jgi:hypothetical protein
VVFEIASERALSQVRVYFEAASGQNAASGKGTGQWVNHMQCDKQAGEGKTLLPLRNLHLARFEGGGDGLLVAIGQRPRKGVFF